MAASLDDGDSSDRVGNVQDARNAIRFLRVHAAEYHLDPNRLAISGESMGGYLALMTGLVKGEASYEPKQPYPGVSNAVTAILDFYGFVDTVRGTPLDYIRPDSPPILIVHGLSEPKISYHQSEELDRALQKAGVPHQLMLLPGSGHGFTLTTSGKEPLSIDLRPSVLAFVRQHLGSAR